MGGDEKSYAHFAIYPSILNKEKKEKSSSLLNSETKESMVTGT